MLLYDKKKSLYQIRESSVDQPVAILWVLEIAFCKYDKHTAAYWFRNPLNKQYLFFVNALSYISGKSLSWLSFGMWSKFNGKLYSSISAYFLVNKFKFKKCAAPMK